MYLTSPPAITALLAKLPKRVGLKLTLSLSIHPAGRLGTPLPSLQLFHDRFKTTKERHT